MVKKPIKKPARRSVGKDSPTVPDLVPDFGPLSLVVYGPSGVGKTEFAANFPDPGFIYDNQEDGICDLVKFGRCKKPVFMEEVDSFENIIAFHEEIADTGTIGNHGQIRTLVEDSLTGVERMCFEYHCREYFEDNWSDSGFYSFYKGPKNAAKRDWPRYIQSLIKVWQSGVNVILIAHSKVSDSDNPSGSDHRMNIPDLDKEIWSQTHKWAKTIVFYGQQTETEKVGTKTKAKSSDYERKLFCEPSPYYVAKNRYGMIPVIDAGTSGAEAYENFISAVAAAYKNQRQPN